VRRPALLFLLALLPAAPTLAADIVERSFSEGEPEGRRALAHVEQKAVVAEYLDPADTGIGKSMAQLLWREVLSSISDQGGAGVILARPPENERLVDLLQENYHQAALRIAEHQQARMALWGSALEKDGRIYIHSFLTMVAATRSNIINFRIRDSYLYGDRSGEIELSFPRNKLNFPMVERSREQLFRRPLMLRGNTNVRSEPSVESPRVGFLEAGAVAQAVDMDDGWFRVALAGGEFGYVTGANVDLAPLSVRADRRGINLRTAPAVRGDTVLRNTDLTGEFRVLEQRFSGNRLWYRIELDGEHAWIAASLVERVYSLPVVHFIAGLYRYFGERHGDAIREFDAFLEYPRERHGNVTMSVAYQYQALSALLSDRNPLAGVELTRKAAAQTPFDATPYKIEALSWIGDPRARDNVAALLEKARALDARPREFSAFAAAVQQAIELR